MSTKETEGELKTDQKYECMGCGAAITGTFRSQRIYLNCPECGQEESEFRTEESKKRLITDIESVLYRLQLDHKEAMSNLTNGANKYRDSTMSGRMDGIRWARSYLKQLQEHRQTDRDHAILVEFDSGLPTDVEIEQMRETFPDDYDITEAEL